MFIYHSDNDIVVMFIYHINISHSDSVYISHSDNYSHIT